MVMLDWKAEIRQHLGVFKKRKCHHGCSGWGRGAVWPENKIPIWSSRLRCTTITAFWTTLTLGHSRTRTVYSIILDLITVSSGFYSSESAERGWNCILVFLCIDTSGAVFSSGHLINNFTLHFHWRWRRSSYASNNPLFHPVIRLSMHSDSFLCFRQTAQQVQFGNPKTLLSIHNQAKGEVTKVQCVSVCVSFYQPAMSCASLQFLLFFSSWSCFSFLLLFMSVLVCLAAVQVLVVGCFRKCTWLSWEVRWAICPQATPLPWPPPLPFFFFF